MGSIATVQHVLHSAAREAWWFIQSNLCLLLFSMATALMKPLSPEINNRNMELCTKLLLHSVQLSNYTDHNKRSRTLTFAHENNSHKKGSFVKHQLRPKTHPKDFLQFFVEFLPKEGFPWILVVQAVLLFLLPPFYFVRINRCTEERFFPSRMVLVRSVLLKNIHLYVCIENNFLGTYLKFILSYAFKPTFIEFDLPYILKKT